MANKRNKAASGRDAGGFVAIPWVVLDCPAYEALSYPAKALMLELARQFVVDNNGKLLASRARLKGRGWTSADVIDRAKRELLEGGFIHETVKGHRPNKASWYAITWQTLDRHAGYDPGAAESFERAAYRKTAPVKNASLSPAGGTERPRIGPSGGTGKPLTVPGGGPIGAIFQGSPVPSGGHHLEKPSVAVVEPASSSAADNTPPLKRPPATTDDDGISQEAIDSLAALWTAVGCRSNWTTPTKADRLSRARDAQQRAIDRHRPKAAAQIGAGAAHDDDGLIRERDEFASDLSHWND